MRSARLLKVAWLSILLGIGMELLLLATAAFFGKNPVLKPVLADLAQKISWSFIICTGIALGTVASKMKAPAMGIAGFAGAPLAFTAAKALHKSVAEAMAIAAPAAGVPSPFALAGIKALQYALLGILLSRFEQKPQPRLTPHLIVGAVIGALFGGWILWLVVQQSPNPVPLAALVTRGINEILFPIGCSAVVGATRQVSTRTR